MMVWKHLLESIKCEKLSLINFNNTNKYILYQNPVRYSQYSFIYWMRSSPISMIRRASTIIPILNPFFFNIRLELWGFFLRISINTFFLFQQYLYFISLPITVLNFTNFWNFLSIHLPIFIYGFFVHIVLFILLIVRNLFFKRRGICEDYIIPWASSGRNYWFWTSISTLSYS